MSTPWEKIRQHSLGYQGLWQLTQQNTLWRFREDVEMLLYKIKPQSKYSIHQRLKSLQTHFRWRPGDKPHTSTDSWSCFSVSPADAILSLSMMLVVSFCFPVVPNDNFISTQLLLNQSTRCQICLNCITWSCYSSRCRYRDCCWRSLGSYNNGSWGWSLSCSPHHWWPWNYHCRLSRAHCGS